MGISGTAEATGIDSSTPRGVLGRAIATASQAAIDVVADLTGLSVTVTVGSGRLIRVSGFGLAQQQTLGGDVQMFIYEDGAQVATARHTAGAAGAYVTPIPIVLRTPSAGSHTYKLRMSTSAGTVTLVAGSTFPAFIAVEDLGAA